MTRFRPLAALRDAIWERSTRHIQEAVRMPRWAVVLRLLLYPGSTLHILTRHGHPYDPFTSTWNLYGARFSDRAIRAMAGRMPHGCWYRFRRAEPLGVICVEEVRSIDSPDAAKYLAELKLLLDAVSRFQQGSPELLGAMVRAGRVAGIPVTPRQP